MARFYIYETTTGRIMRAGHCQPMDVSIQAEAGETVVEADGDPVTQRVNLLTLELEDKPVLPTSIDKLSIIANGIDSCIISDIPNPTTLDVEGEGRWEVIDGEFEFTTDTVGEYRIILLSQIHLEQEYVVNAS